MLTEETGVQSLTCHCPSRVHKQATHTLRLFCGSHLEPCAALSTQRADSRVTQDGMHGSASSRSRPGELLAYLKPHGWVFFHWIIVYIQTHLPSLLEYPLHLSTEMPLASAPATCLVSSFLSSDIFQEWEDQDNFLLERAWLCGERKVKGGLSVLPSNPL